MTEPASPNPVAWLLRAYAAEDREALVELWRQCGLTRPWNNPYLDIERKLKHRPEWLRIAEVRRSANRWRLIGSVMIGYEGHRGWVNYLAVHPQWRRHGLGRALMQHAEQLLLAEACPKVNLQIRSDNDAVRAFYARLGYQVDEVTSMGKRLIQDD